MRRRGRIFEELLVVEARAGSRDAFEALVRSFHPRLVRLATTLVGPVAAHDVVQEAWLGVYQGFARLQDPERFRPWVFQVVANKCRDWVRRRSRERRGIERLRAEPVALTTELDAPIEDSARQHAALRSALAELPPEHRATLELYYLEELGVADIARTLGTAPGTVKSRLFYARRKCRAALERAGRTS